MARTLLPCACALCGEAAPELVCAPCAARHAMRRPARCPCCANPLGALDAAAPRCDSDPAAAPRCDSGPAAAQRCGACLAAAPAFDATVAAVDYAAPLDALVLRLKFGAQLPLAAWFGERLYEAVAAAPAQPLPDVLCPVPLGPRRLVERGFNQALEIARPLAAALGVDLAPSLALRQVETAAQSSVAPQERARNMRNAFAVAPGLEHLVAGRHVGVVDDVMTSGHTLHALAAALKAAGAARVTNLVFARTPPH